MDDAGFNCFNAFDAHERCDNSRGLDLVAPGKVNAHALADEEGRQRHVDVPRGGAASAARFRHVLTG